MIVTTLSRLTMCADDLVLLDRMAASAGKSRDVFVSDVLFEMFTMERMILGNTADRKAGEHGTNTNHKA